MSQVEKKKDPTTVVVQPVHHEPWQISSGSEGSREHGRRKEKEKKSEEGRVKVHVSPADPVFLDRIEVVFGPNDPDNPKNWSRLRRWYITVFASILVLNATFASAAPSGLTEALMEQFGFSQEVGILSISLFVAGYCVGPILWGPLSETYGRKPVFVGTFFVYTMFQIGCALSQNTASILVFRFLGGTFAAGPLANSGAVIADIWDASTRGKAMSMFTIAPFVGPAVGPSVSGYFFVAGVSWRWIFWLLAIFAGVCNVLIIFTLPETYGPIILAHRAAKLRKENNDDRYYAAIELKKETFRQRVENILFKPFQVLMAETMLIAITIYMSFTYGVVYLLFEAYPVVFAQGHGFNPGASGLMLLNLVVGSMIGAVIYTFWLNPRYDRAVQKHAPSPVPPEFRLQVAALGTPLFSISFFWFAWTSFPSVSFVSPLIAGGLMGTAIYFIFLALFNYMIDSYLQVAASALAANTICRSLAGAAFPLFASQMFEALNPRWAGTLLGCVSLLLMPLPFILMRYGARLRVNSKYCPATPSTVTALKHSVDLSSRSRSSWTPSHGDDGLIELQEIGDGHARAV
ncbi:MFS general substrate transporter [Dendrothele bispora CBS 962.96]|uniref:MFS general substrate transporter n=1 Tax=Dendrothele bispora (strain CBS 962.96) TaxID=1314807 RepID=A0A4S8LZG7_DENBC|nr:MFS general substrate transporter [Dendrothele bispora CBS 962.96]